MQCGDSQACQIIIDHVIPFLGVFTGLTIYLAPWKDVHASLRLGTLLDSVNPLVFSTMAPNCIGWVLYGMYNQNYYVAVPSFLGYLFGTYYLLITGGMSSPDRQRLAIRTYLGFISLVFVSSIVSFISLSTLNGGSVGKQLVGWTCVLILVFMYASPLTTMWEVLKTRNSASIGLPLALGKFV
ncbi:hypothetical protein HK096_000611 [Nowakowskiella sp. JEL0078]|nr:hypothetical protein HK096_000611 [Nowakowskiella sp. JEL0078]